MIVPLAHAKGFIPAADYGLEKDLPMIFWESRAPDPIPETDTGKGGRPSLHEFADYKNVFPTKDSLGLELGPLHRLLNQNKEIPKKSLHGVLKKWEEDCLIEIIRPDGRPMRYRSLL